MDPRGQGVGRSCRTKMDARCDDGEAHHVAVAVLYGSESGATQGWAEMAASKLRQHGLDAHARRLDEEGASALAMATSGRAWTLFLVSTAGKGDAPSGARSFWSCLRRKWIQNNLLRRAKCAVLALGDSAYLEYNYFGKRLHNRLVKLGAHMVVPLRLGDAQEEGGHLAAVEDWLVEARRAILDDLDGRAPSWKEETPRYRVVVHETCDAKELEGDETELLHEPHEAGAAFRRLATWAPRLMAEQDLAENELEVLAALRSTERTEREINVQVKSNECIASGGDVPKVHHVVFTRDPGEVQATNERPIDENDSRSETYCSDTSEEGKNGLVYGGGEVLFDTGDPSASGRMLDEGQRDQATDRVLPMYRAGDCVAVYPETMCEDVHKLLDRLGINGSYLTTVQLNPEHFGRCASEPTPPVKFIAPLEVWFQGALDVGSAAPQGSFFEAMAQFATAQHEKDRLRFLATREGHTTRAEYCDGERRTVAEILCEDFPSVRPTMPWLFHASPRLRARLFSAASAWADSPSQVALTATLSEWTTPFGRARTGLFARWIQGVKRGKVVHIEIVGADGDISRFVKQSLHRPLLLVATGAGIAPVRAFARERLLLQGSTLPTAVVFGCRRRHCDFLHASAWASESQLGLFRHGGAFVLACSRDSASKVYVQHRIKQHAGRIWDFMKHGGCIFVCGGSTTGMPDAVALALEHVARQVGGLSQEESRSWRLELVRKGRYCVEAWT